jgi:CubicO group peptidase (beta-lactamase class C family)
MEWDWREAPPEAAGMDAPGVRAMVAWVEAQRAKGLAGAQLVVLRRGLVVLDRCFGVANRATGSPITPASIFLIYSASKPYMALLIHLLAERGVIALDAPVAEYWPEFGGNGKTHITLRHVLQHRSGLPVAALAELRALPDWERSIAQIARSRPRTPPGAVVAYQPFAQGFILGEVARQVTGQPVQRFLAEVFLGPLELRDTFLGLPDEAWERRVTVHPAGGIGERVNAMVFNRRRYRQAIVPSATISATARDVARFYEMLRRGGELDGTRVLAPSSVAEARRVTADNELDRTIGWRVRWAQGFHLGGNVGPREMGRLMGAHSNPETFGHNGNVCCNAWVDPTRELVFVYLTSYLLPLGTGVRVHGELSDLALAACR